MVDVCVELSNYVKIEYVFICFFLSECTFVEKDYFLLRILISDIIGEVLIKERDEQFSMLIRVNIVSLKRV